MLVSFHLVFWCKILFLIGIQQDAEISALGRKCKAIRGKNGKQSRRTSRRGDRRKRTIKIRESSLGSGVEEERVELSVSSTSTHSLYSLSKNYCLCNRKEEGEQQDRDTMLWVLKCFVETVRTGIFSLMTGRPGPSGFGSATTAEQVTQGIDASGLTAIVTG